MRKIFGFILISFLTQGAFAAELNITSKYVKKAALDPMSKVWDKAEIVSVPLIRQNLVAPHGGGAVKEVEVRSLYTNSEIFIRLTWIDETKDTQFSMTEKFSDACAIEMPMNSEILPSFIMGEKNIPVNIWIWHAKEEGVDFPPAYSDYYRKDALHAVLEGRPTMIENLIAEGFGTITPLEIQDVEGKGVWKDGKWNVVLKRKLESASGVALKKDLSFPIAFAIWDGGSKDRDGAKSVSPWHILSIGRAPAIEMPKDAVKAGERVYLRYGCVTCHGREGKISAKNLNAQGGKVPALTYVAEGFTGAELKDRISKGRSPEKEDVTGPYPPLRMNAWKSVMDETELDNLVQYLLSLMPKTEGW